MKKIYKFIRSGPAESTPLPPIEAYKVVPDWYKDLAPYRFSTSNNKKYLSPMNDRGSDGTDSSTKSCTSFMDAFMSGYMYLLEEDLHVDIDENGRPKVSWASENLLDIRGTVDLAIPSDVHPVHYGVRMYWYYETPPGYSTLITHPLNRPDLPFWTPSGIVDSDIWGLPAFIPFFIKKNFIGTIEKGTPVCQMIPIKREDWEMKIDLSDEGFMKHKVLEEKRRSKFTGYYKATTWHKKKY